MPPVQQEFSGFDLPPKVDAIDFFSLAPGESRGEVFTRREVVEFILDLIGWGRWESTEERKNCRLLEPSCGAGDFLLPAIYRYLDKSEELIPEKMASAFMGIEVNLEAVAQCRDKVVRLLVESGMSRKDSLWLSQQWVRHADFLTFSFDESFTHVAGNPPYLRQESLPTELLDLYRSKYSTMYDRADLYVPFFEKSLKLLQPGGRHGFICSDRWMKNKYGGPLRGLVANDYHLMQASPATEKA